MPLNEALLAELSGEATKTRKILERVPGDKFDWKPHPRSMTIGRLASHIAEIPLWIPRIVENTIWDAVAAGFKPNNCQTPDLLLELFDDSIENATQALRLLPENATGETWTLRRSEQLLMSLPRKDALRGMAFNHSYHHRGQLTVYLRLLEIAVPGMYGPTADEK